MNNFTALLAPLALLLPASLAEVPKPSAEAGQDELGLVAEWADFGEPQVLGEESQPSRQPLSAAIQPEKRSQVRIERSVTIRITPRAPANQADLLAQLPQGPTSTHLEERNIGSCLLAGNIAGVGTTKDNRLILFMRDRRIISVALEKSCSARDFYSGFYIEHQEDGKLCAKRDTIHSRAGTKCGLKQIRQLIAVRD